MVLFSGKTPGSHGISDFHLHRQITRQPRRDHYFWRPGAGAARPGEALCCCRLGLCRSGHWTHRQLPRQHQWVAAWGKQVLGRSAQGAVCWPTWTRWAQFIGGDKLPGSQPKAGRGALNVVLMLHLRLSDFRMLACHGKNGATSRWLAAPQRSLANLAVRRDDEAGDSSARQKRPFTFGYFNQGFNTHSRMHAVRLRQFIVA